MLSGMFVVGFTSWRRWHVLHTSNTEKNSLLDYYHGINSKSNAGSVAND